MLALLYKAPDPIGVGMSMAIAWGAVTGGVVAAGEIAGRFDQK